MNYNKNYIFEIYSSKRIKIMYRKFKKKKCTKITMAGLNYRNTENQTEKYRTEPILGTKIRDPN